jgi:uncharacterized protein DUF3667
MTATTPERSTIASEPAASIVAAETCVNCGTVLRGPYCTECGERRATARDYSFWTFIEEAFQTFTNADGSFFGSVKTLLLRPGELTADYMRGRRVGLMRPLQLFLMVNVVYFLFVGITHFQLLSTNLGNHMNNTWHKELARRMVNQRLGDGTVSAEVYKARLAQYRIRFDQAVEVQSKTLIFTMVPAFALFVWLLQIRKRRYVVEHIVFSLHMYSAFLIMAVLSLFLIGLPMAAVDALLHTNAAESQYVDKVLGLTMCVILLWYLRRALARVYGDGPVFSTVGALFLTFGLVIVLFAYRTLLFLTTFWATSR